MLDVDGDIVMPGLINTHTHASMTVFRSLADDVPDRLHRYIFPLENKMVSRDMVRVGANLANVEMVKGGVTTYVDMYYFEDEVAKTVDKMGNRAILGESVINFPVADAQTLKKAFNMQSILLMNIKITRVLLLPLHLMHLIPIPQRTCKKLLNSR